MCGIAGIAWREPRAAQATTTRLERMRALLRHRGPDDSGIELLADERIGLLNTRLAIRDLSPAGRMPMRSLAQPLCITYNGEIYNADELRIALRALGHRFRSSSDTEVVLAGYEYWGTDVVRRLRGMFAFAICNDVTGALFLARDPLGIKPLYYSASAEAFAFASEIKALVGAELASHDLEPAALSAYLQLGSVPAPLTMFRGVHALEPGSTMQVDAAGHIRADRYYQLPPPGTHHANGGVLRGLLSDAVTSHLVADVPVGAFLSGGLDSSVVVALAAAHAPGVTTCTVRFDEAAEDESQFARAVAQKYGTDHHEITVTAADVVHEVPRLVSAIDQPSIDGFNTFFISRAAAQLGLKVVLSGLGGDELFGGYPSFKGVPRVMRAMRSARAIAGGRLAARVVATVGRTDRWHKVADAVRRPTTPESAFLTFRGLFAPSEAAALTGDAFMFDALEYVRARAAGSGDAADWISRAELRTYTANQLLRDADVMSMAHSLELRVPLLDTVLVNRVLGIPAQERLTGNGSKPLLRAAVSDLLPADVLARRQKRGFTFPMAAWLRSPEAAALWNFDDAICGVIDTSAAAAVRASFLSGRTHWSRAWSLILLNEWYQRVLNG